MLWWDRDDLAFEDLVGGLAHLNRRPSDEIDREYDRYMRALKRLAKGYAGAQLEDPDTDKRRR